MEFEQVKERMEALKRKTTLAALEEPFDPELIYWKPQAISKAKDKAVAAAYADPRVYSDRLNEVLGPDGWSVRYEVSTIAPIAGPDPKDWKNKFTYKGKVMVVALLIIEGLGSNSGTGESDAVDENAITSAEAQAFKRAATRFGLGRYLYDLPKNQWVPYDETTRRITDPPTLPDWAIPSKSCEDCKVTIEPFQHNGRTLSITELIANSNRKYKKQLCASCQQIRAGAAKTAEMTRAV